MKFPRVVLATDHAGYKLKEAIKAYLIDSGIDVVDEGTFSEEAVDYPAVIRRGCAHVLDQKIPGIVFGGSGQGEAIAANKVPGIRAARCLTVEDARLARSHNDANVLSLAGRMTDPETAVAMVEAFLQTPFEGGRHVARVRDLEPEAVVPFFEKESL
jgi:ribose 5-phosphate isomerase B